MRTTARLSALAFGTAIAVAGLGATAAHAASPTVVRTHGTCSASSTWKMKLKVQDVTHLQSEFEVQAPVAGQAWTVRITDNGAPIFSGRRTAGPSFTVRKVSPNQAGVDAVTAVATNTVTGEVCTGKASL